MTLMLDTISLLRIENPKAMASSLFVSHSLSACVAALFELREDPPRFEEFGVKWFEQLDKWAHARQAQVITFTDAFTLRGFNIRFAFDTDTSCTYVDGTVGHRMEAYLLHGESVVFNPSGIDIGGAPVATMKVVFVPYDPTPTTSVLD